MATRFNDSCGWVQARSIKSLSLLRMLLVVFTKPKMLTKEISNSPLEFYDPAECIRFDAFKTVDILVVFITRKKVLWIGTIPVNLV